MIILKWLFSRIKKRRESYELSGEFIFLKNEVQMAQKIKKILADDAGKNRNEESSEVITFPKRNIQ